VSAGKISIVGITDKWVSKNFCIERCHIYPSNLEYSIKNHIIEKTKAVINILGIDNSPFHLEAKLTSDGFKIIECAARAAGDSITTHIIPLSLAVSHVENCLLASMGQEIQSLKRPNYHAAVLFIFATQAGILSSIKGLEQVIQHPVVVSCKMHCSIGDKLSIPPEEFLNHRVLTIFLRDYEYLNIINTVKWIEKTVDVKIN
ncbi:MAG: ATP-grasp domain-containing protein, partial [Alphaproteobacteria bacterium]|nr:ATP-grasp domain-containing protein [Alphaproteobacteria bacterium]